MCLAAICSTLPYAPLLCAVGCGVLRCSPMWWNSAFWFVRYALGPVSVRVVTKHCQV